MTWRTAGNNIYRRFGDTANVLCYKTIGFFAISNFSTILPKGDVHRIRQIHHKIRHKSDHANASPTIQKLMLQRILEANEVSAPIFPNFPEGVDANGISPVKFPQVSGKDDTGVQVAIHFGGTTTVRSCATVVGVGPAVRFGPAGRVCSGTPAGLPGWQQQNTFFTLYRQERGHDISDAEHSRRCREALKTSEESVAIFLDAVNIFVDAIELGSGSKTYSTTEAANFAKELAERLPNIDEIICQKVPSHSGGAENAMNGRVPTPTTMLQPTSSIWISPAFFLQSRFLLSVVEPNVSHDQQKLIEQLTRLACLRYPVDGRPDWNVERRTCAAPDILALESCYLRILSVAGAMNAETLSIPLIGTGEAGFPPYASAYAAAGALTQWKQKQDRYMLRKIVFCAIDTQQWRALRGAFMASDI